MESKDVLRMENAGKKYRGSNVWALKDFNLTCGSHEITALIGINGAGKTTTLRLAASTLKPSEGIISINSRYAHRSRAGILFGGTSGLYKRLTGRENILYFAQLNGIKKETAEKTLQKLSRWLNLYEFLDIRAGKFSTGMLQRTLLARGLIHDPPLLLLDEPANGLDPRAAESIYSFISACRDEGKTVIFSTHNLHAAQRLSDRIVLLHKGKCIAAGTCEDFAHKAGLPGDRILEDSFFALTSPDSADMAEAHTGGKQCR